MKEHPVITLRDIIEEDNVVILTRSHQDWHRSDIQGVPDGRVLEEQAVHTDNASDLARGETQELQRHGPSLGVACNDDLLGPYFLPNLLRSGFKTSWYESVKDRVGSFSELRTGDLVGISAQQNFSQFALGASGKISSTPAALR
eukprot:CAMPEP_0170616396 /NCGR_PEP_ID=MMETSP0224-20130122/25848_1 /TAXON_ID=285029 /ORGANISM="Togula jolla, Strain CCCM 725" /LENGTH=143 /DNA_ID=CAMNT_0010942191 /DNA_START=251 /DNA_END=683 /DNA_ORIENTATION=-